MLAFKYVLYDSWIQPWGFPKKSSWVLMEYDLGKFLLYALIIIMTTTQDQVAFTLYLTYS